MRAARHTSEDADRALFGFTAADYEPTKCDVCERADILDGDDPGFVFDEGHTHGVAVCSEECTEKALAAMEQDKL